MPSYRFGEFTIDVARRQLLRDATPVALTPRLFDALLFFVEHPGELLDKDRLFAALWPGLVVEENSLSQTVSALRRALGDDPQAARYVQTVPRRGFRFVAEVTRHAAVAPSAVPGIATPRRSVDPPDAADEAPTVPDPKPVATRRRLVVGATTGAALAAAAASGWWWHTQRSARVADPPTTLAVLPFRPLVAEARDEVLEMGMADSLVARLSTLPGVAVRSVGSVRRYAGPEQDPLRAARDLGVAWIVDGSIQRWGSKVRVSARLLDAASGEAAWSGNFDEDFTGMFDLQDAISTRVSQVLAPHLGATGRRRLAGSGGTRDIDAWQSYLAGRHQAQGIRTASIALYQRAIALDSRFALAHVGLAESRRRMIFGADGEPAATFAAAKADVQHAIDIDPDLSDAYAGQGWNRFWSDWDWAGAERTFRRAIALNANDVNAHFGYGQLLEMLGRDSEAMARMATARELDPQSLILLTLESASLFSRGRRDEGRERLQRVFDIEPDFWVAHLAFGLMLLDDGKVDEAIDSMERADRNADGSSQAGAALGFVLARHGRVRQARALLARFADAERSRYVPPTSAGLVHAGLGDRDAALTALKRGYAVRDVRMTLVRRDGRWALVRDDPRFVALMKRMQLAA